MRKKPLPSKTRKPPRRPPSPKANDGREGGTRALSSLRRQNLSSVGRRYPPIEQQHDNYMKRTAASRQSSRRWDQLIASGQAKPMGPNGLTIGNRPKEQQTSSIVFGGPASRKRTKKPTR